MSLTKFHLFYIQYLQLQREIKLSIGYKTFLWQFHTTHISDFNSFWVHVNMHMIWKTHTCVFLMCIKRQKHTHTHDTPVWNALLVNMYVFGMLVLKYKKFIWSVVLLANWPNITCTHSNSTQSEKRKKEKQVSDMSKKETQIQIIY